MVILNDLVEINVIESSRNEVNDFNVVVDEVYIEMDEIVVYRLSVDN